ncbi:phosphosulfolactate synthase [Salibacteraceae bacterium]|nr:phosphosulfolactate synthase [Crocinitomicaceae bacterium]MCH9822315.1 phosphosulfolactate synthase [Bacteroidota bacterium]MDA9938256.1 phosphosulfolactate synthase [Salibacteraceae bacterium]MDA9967659.1 phosphosulfolactate synthase [Salibacteraceae bacterium]MDB0057941.1 phosphosulfolactate synthase [Salibacteraceae bacterium]
MNYTLPYIPNRTEKPRNTGLTMMMDKGLSVRQVEDFLEQAGDLTDYVKLGFGTSFCTKRIEEKIKLYHEADIKVYLGGTLFEAFLIRDKYDDYKKLLNKLNLNCAEISDGSIYLDHGKKCELIADLSKEVQVLSEVGSKEEGIFISPGMWISMMKNELEAGSFKVIAEARESGNVGIYRPNGTAHTMLVNKIIANIDVDNILWEAPKKPQQVWFIDQFGHNVNLGNIGYDEVIPLETLRVGLRGDTFMKFLPESLVDKNIE